MIADTVPVTLQRETLAVLWDELMPLFKRHYDEISANKDIPLEPDVEGYRAVEESDALRLYVARSEGRPLGYAMYFVRTNLHYRSSKQAVEDIIFLAPEVRGTGLGIELVNYADDQLREEGVQVVYHHAKLAHPQLGNMLVKRCGYKAIETIYSKRLDK